MITTKNKGKTAKKTDRKKEEEWKGQAKRKVARPWEKRTIVTLKREGCSAEFAWLVCMSGHIQPCASLFFNPFPTLRPTSSGSTLCVCIIVRNGICSHAYSNLRLGTRLYFKKLPCWLMRSTEENNTCIPVSSVSPLEKRLAQAT